MFFSLKCSNYARQWGKDNDYKVNKSVTAMTRRKQQQGRTENTFAVDVSETLPNYL